MITFICACGAPGVPCTTCPNCHIFNGICGFAESEQIGPVQQLMAVPQQGCAGAKWNLVNLAKQKMTIILTHLCSSCEDDAIYSCISRYSSSRVHSTLLSFRCPGQCKDQFCEVFMATILLYILSCIATIPSGIPGWLLKFDAVNQSWDAKNGPLATTMRGVMDSLLGHGTASFRLDAGYRTIKLMNQYLQQSKKLYVDIETAYLNAIYQQITLQCHTASLKSVCINYIGFLKFDDLKSPYLRWKRLAEHLRALHQRDLKEAKRIVGGDIYLLRLMTETDGVKQGYMCAEAAVRSKLHLSKLTNKQVQTIIESDLDEATKRIKKIACGHRS